MEKYNISRDTMYFNPNMTSEYGIALYGSIPKEKLKYIEVERTYQVMQKKVSKHMKGVTQMSDMTIGNEKNILFYSDENGQTKVEVILQDENVWLNVNAIATLFDVQRPAIVKHINNIYNDEELSKKSTCSILEQAQVEGNRSVKRQKEILAK